MEPPATAAGDETTIASAENTSQVESVDENEADPPSTSDTGGRESDASDSSGAPSEDQGDNSVWQRHGHSPNDLKCKWDYDYAGEAARTVEVIQHSKLSTSVHCYVPK